MSQLRPKIAASKPDGSCLGSPPARVAPDLVDFHVKESGVPNALGGGGPRTEPPIGCRPFIVILMNDLRFRAMREGKRQFRVKAKAEKRIWSNKYGSLPSCVGRMHGNERSDLEDLAFPSRASRESNEVGRRVCLSMRELNPLSLLIPEIYGPRSKTNMRSYAGAEKDGEGMALRIRGERRHFRVFHHPIYQR
jgi:hypothetical protein